MQFMRQCEKTW